MVPKLSHIACLSFLLLHLESWTHAELYTAIVDMEPLLQTQKRIIDDLDHYIVKEEERITLLKRHLERYKLEHEKAMEDKPNYLGNPLNAFTLIKRLTTDLDAIEDSMKNGTENIKNVTTKHADVKYPTLEDLTGAMEGLSRLQTTYQLSAHELAQGVLDGVQYSYPLSAADCYELTKTLYKQKHYENSRAWAMEALDKLREETGAHSFTEIDLLEYISFAHYSKGDAKSALEWTEKLLALAPDHHRAQVNMVRFKISAAKQEEVMRKMQQMETGNEPSEAEKEKFLKMKYEAMCRDELGISSHIAKRLKCRYLTENHPFLRLAPLKVEQVFISPDVFVFHEVISDDEIQLIQDMAMPKLKRAAIRDENDANKSMYSNHRISKLAWLHDNDSVVVARVSRRVSDMTGLSVASAEKMQVLNYGIGGQYDPHYDFKLDYSRSKNDRIATVLFYMSEVEQGGATVFPQLGLSVFPAKNTALFWLNLHPSGEGDMATRHAGCPVLRGSKWVFTKWLHESGQELLKPCSIDYQQKGIQGQNPPPSR